MSNAPISAARCTVYAASLLAFAVASAIALAVGGLSIVPVRAAADDPAVTSDPTVPADPAEASNAREETEPPTEQPDADASDGKIDFRRDIRPLLSNACYECHGPDAEQRQADLRLDIKAAALAELDSGNRPIVPGDSAASAVYLRIASDDPFERMPPEDSGKQLSPEEMDLIRRWIDEGAPWQEHWAFIKPQRPPLPAVRDTAWSRNEIDRFILARLEAEGLAPSAEADRSTLIRRLTLDLTGLPPTPDEVAAFVADDSADAYERLVERLLGSPRYGEHQARYWLDAARYGDTHGLHLDNFRSMWPYRDWVVDALNRNLPFDEFTVEQLAGDLLPDPTPEQRIATGFNRCNVTTSEGGAIDEEFRVRYAIDRTETTGTVWLGLTIGCAVCHAHKYDPISQEEFYSLYSYFNSVRDPAMDGNRPDTPPVVKVPSPGQQQSLDELARSIAEVRAELTGPHDAIDTAQLAWEAEWRARLHDQWTVLDIDQAVSEGGATLRKLDDGSILAEGTNADRDVYELSAVTDLAGITALRLEALTDESLPSTGPGRADNANFVLSELELEIAPRDAPGEVQTVRFVAARADFSQEDGGYLIEKAIDGIVDATNGWAVAGHERHEPRTAVFLPEELIGFDGGTLLRVRLRHESQFARHNIGRVRLSVSNDPVLLPARLEPWHVAGPYVASSGDEAYQTTYPPEEAVDLTAATAEGTPLWTQRSDLADGTPLEFEGEYCATYLYRTITVEGPRRLTLLVGSDDALKIWLNGQVVHDKNVQRGLTPEEDRLTVDLVAGDNQLLIKLVNYQGAYSLHFVAREEEGHGELAGVAPLLARAPAERSEAQQAQLREFYRSRHWPEWASLSERLAQLEKQRDRLEKDIPTTLVMQDMDELREAVVLIRGEYDRRGEPVRAGVPAAIHPPLPGDAPPTRLTLARWLVDPEHPLTARVTVNRVWQQLFGTGIVKTSEDFGSQGQVPSHPELLDWLAVRFVDSGWDMKELLRMMVHSATYRQSSAVTPELVQRDRENRLLARGPRFRLDAETIRDVALATSGLMVERPGGPSVKPYQPPGIWEAVGYTSSNTAKFTRDSGEALYRRSVYTFWKRTAPPPTLTTFDAPSREACTVRRSRTNTPLQALALLNDEPFVEAARHLAQRLLLEGGTTPAERIAHGYQLVVSRAPRPDELALVSRLLESQWAEFRADPEAAAGLLTVGESAADPRLDPCELAAWTIVAGILLNLDETVTKG